MAQKVHKIKQIIESSLWKLDRLNVNIEDYLDHLKYKFTKNLSQNIEEPLLELSTLNVEDSENNNISHDEQYNNDIIHPTSSTYTETQSELSVTFPLQHSNHNDNIQHTPDNSCENSQFRNEPLVSITDADLPQTIVDDDVDHNNTNNFNNNVHNIQDSLILDVENGIQQTMKLSQIIISSDSDREHSQQTEALMEKNISNDASNNEKDELIDNDETEDENEENTNVTEIKESQQNIETKLTEILMPMGFEKDLIQWVIQENPNQNNLDTLLLFAMNNGEYYNKNQKEITERINNNTIKKYKRGKKRQLNEIVSDESNSPVISNKKRKLSNNNKRNRWKTNKNRKAMYSSTDGEESDSLNQYHNNNNNNKNKQKHRKTTKASKVKQVKPINNKIFNNKKGNHKWVKRAHDFTDESDTEEFASIFP